MVFFSLVYVSTLTSLAIAVDRYFVIVHPFRSRMRLGVCLLLIVIIWIVGISISLPLAIYMRFDSIKCDVNLQFRSMIVKLFLSCSLVFFYLFPLGILASIHIAKIFQFFIISTTIFNSFLGDFI